MRMHFLIALVIVAPLLGADEAQPCDGLAGGSPCVVGTMAGEDASVAQDPSVECDESEEAVGAGEEVAQSGLRPGLLAQRSVTCSPAWAGFGVGNAGERVESAEEDPEDSLGASPRRERWKRFGIGALHVLDFLTELYLELY